MWLGNFLINLGNFLHRIPDDGSYYGDIVEGEESFQMRDYETDRSYILFIHKGNTQPRYEMLMQYLKEYDPLLHKFVAYYLWISTPSAIEERQVGAAVTNGKCMPPFESSLIQISRDNQQHAAAALQLRALQLRAAQSVKSQAGPLFGTTHNFSCIIRLYHHWLWEWINYVVCKALK